MGLHEAGLRHTLSTLTSHKASAYPGVAIACTPSGVDADAKAAFLFLHRDGDVGQRTAVAADGFPETDEEANLDRLHPRPGSTLLRPTRNQNAKEL